MYPAFARATARFPAGLTGPVWPEGTPLCGGGLRPLCWGSPRRRADTVMAAKAVGAPIEIVLNREVVLARGEVVEVGDEYGVRITEILSDKGS